MIEQNKTMTTVIATRRLLWRRASGVEVTIETRFGIPERQPEGDWYCPYEIVRFPGNVTEAESIKGGEILVQRVTFGVDAVQALYLALFIVGTELSTLDGSPDPDAVYGPGLGFPANLL